jgi:uncharacterized protein YndB with AHSA1/START domain
MTNKVVITVEATVNAPISKVWECWTSPNHITKWCQASPDWHAPRAENDLREGGAFSTRMEAKDGSFGFDFGGVYSSVVVNEKIEYTIGDGRNVKILFDSTDTGVKITESFDAESVNPVEMQQAGWQAILNNFKSYSESV